ncbi:hypothetical protein LPUS_03859 [Lasallia pustulata]|uniref:Uncharacterized protein n=1 Tax=Lasallia pustulata TaxID=136370 RepID=A0A1W5CW52_9LECA|nr:hypothetical protein LPUS_03859 [Lasallia pustulata]
MVQRRLSVTSNGSGPARPGMQRQNSSGSMTERTFRDPSPGRGTPARVRAIDPPPVPSVPRGYASPPPIPAKSERRASSVEPPQRVSSPPPKAGGRGVSLDRGPGVMTARPKGQAKPRVASLNSVAEAAQNDNRGSINFSRPMSPSIPRLTSPTDEQRPTSASSASRSGGKPLVDYRPVKSGRIGEADNVQNSLQQAANSPVKKKKKVVTKSASEGSHLANAIASAAPMASNSAPRQQPQPLSSTVSPSNPISQPTSMSEPTITAPKEMKKKKVVLVNTDETDQRADSRFSDDSVSDTGSEQSYSSDRPRTFNSRPLLTKQPSMVREDREAEELEERGMAAAQSNGQVASNGMPASKPAAAPANTSKKFTDSRQHNRSISQPLPSLTASDRTQPVNPSLGVSSGNGRGSAAARGGSHQSMSPARAAHFSSQLQTSEGIKHNPLPRSVSPAKSALKHSPSRGTSPVGNMPGGMSRAHGAAPSEASDTTSVISDDGSRLAKNKKNARVSFDNETVIVGRGASPPTSPDSPMPLSPQNTDTTKKGWFKGRDKKSTMQEASASQDVDDVIKPMPTLPSFGSVRGKNEKAESQEIPQTSWASDALARMNMSSDLAVGSIISQDFANKTTGPGPNVASASNEPLPPLVTSVEGTGGASDTESNDSSTKPEEDDRPRDNSVPMIAVQPATPGLEDSQRSGDWFTMPGGYRNSIDFEEPDAASSSPVVEHHPTDPTPASIGIAEPEPTAAIDAEHPPHPPIGELSENLRHQIEPKDEDESDDTDDSIYSDAAEDLSDFEGDGFGSINAIVESPASPALSSTGLAMTTPPDSPSVRLPASRVKPQTLLVKQGSESSEPGPDEGWDRAQAYWSGLSQSRKQQLEEASSSVAPKQELEQPKAKPKKKKKIVPNLSAQPSNGAPAPLPPWPDRQYRDDIARSSPPTAPAMKKSMRGAPANSVDDSYIRTSMRDGQPLKSALRSSSTRNSLQLPNSAEPKGALQKKTRPVSAVATVDYNKAQPKSTVGHYQARSGALSPVIPQPSKTSPTPGKIAASKAAAPKPVVPKSNLRRNASNGSDSSSSFKRTRSVTSDTGRYSMKRTMRGSSVSEQPTYSQPGRSGAFSLRSLSPTESTTARRPFNSAGPSMRTSMRDSVDLSSRAKSPTRSFGFGKNSKSFPVPAKTNKSRFSKKFDDSSDEEDGGAAYRSSRFADSSDEDEPIPIKTPTNLTPVRGIPKRIDEGDSTDLEDSEIEKAPRLPKKGTPTAAVPKLEGAALATGSLRTPGSGMDTQPQEMGTGLQAKKAAERDKKKGSFFGLLGKKKDESKAMRADAGSPARLNTPTERSKADRTPIPTSPSPASPSAAASPGTPQRPGGKLQRRNTPKRYASYAADGHTWPLPAVPPIPAATAEARPTTSDGVVGNGRPNVGTRQSTAPPGKTAMAKGAQTEPGGAAKTEKKRRFPLLRKAFRFHD